MHIFWPLHYVKRDFHRPRLWITFSKLENILSPQLVMLPLFLWLNIWDKIWLGFLSKLNIVPCSMMIHLLRNRDYKADMRLLHFYSFRLGNVTFQATPISSKPKEERKKKMKSWFLKTSGWREKPLNNVRVIKRLWKAQGGNHLFILVWDQMRNRTPARREDQGRQEHQGCRLKRIIQYTTWKRYSSAHVNNRKTEERITGTWRMKKRSEALPTINRMHLGETTLQKCRPGVFHSLWPFHFSS